MSMKQFDRRKLLAAGAFTTTAAAVGIRAVVAHDGEGTPKATPGTPHASPVASPAAASGETATITGVDIGFEPSELAIPADVDVEIVFVNEGVLEHDLHIEDTEFASDHLMGEGSTTMTVNLPAGEYAYICTVAGHREAGMEGTLIVE